MQDDMADSIVYVRKLRAPRTHRHRYFGVLAPNSPLRAAVTAMAAAPAQVGAVQTQPDDVGIEAWPDWAEAAQPASDFEVDQRVSW